MPSRVLLLSQVLLLSVVLAPMAQGATEVRLFGQMDVPLADFVPAESPPSSSPLSPRCDAQHFALVPDGRGFRFQESTGESGCLHVRHNVSLPTGIMAFEVRFVANRSVQNVNPGATHSLVQSVGLVEDGHATSQWPVFEAHEGTRPYKPVVQPLRLLGPSDGQVQVEWRFADEGKDPASGTPAVLAAFGATVRDASIHFPDIPLEAPTEQTKGALRQQQYLTLHALRAEVPMGFREAAMAGRFSLRLEAPVALWPVRIDGPDGRPLESSEYGTALADGRHHVTIPAATLQVHGAGPFTFHFEETGTLQIDATYRWLSYIALGAPAVTIVVAWTSLRRTRTEPVDP